jgi:ubiquinone/menaquinone biosynthesis C-methylase UbiE
VTPRDAVHQEYAGAAPRYDERWAGYLAETTRRTLAHIRLAPAEILLDVGSGTGVMLREAADRFPGSVLVGVDLSLAMLQAARHAGTRHGLLAADAARLPVATGTCDVVVTASSLHFWPDPASGVRELARVVRPGGTLVVTDWCNDFRTTRLVDRWLRWTRRASYDHVLGAGECAALLEAAGFRVERVERYRVGMIWGLMTLRAALAGGPAGRQP